MRLASRIVEAADLEAAVELCFENRWTAALPVVPPTRGAIERILDYLERDPREVVGIVPPRNGVATIEKVAINCAMAGCRAAVRAACHHGGRGDARWACRSSGFTSIGNTKRAITTRPRR